MFIKCAICFDVLQLSKNSCVTTCGHVFHHLCLSEWMQTANTCPECRSNINANDVNQLYLNYTSDTNEEGESSPVSGNVGEIILNSANAGLHALAGVPIPTGAIQAGVDSDNSPIFVGKAEHAGDELPAKVIPSKHIAYVSYDGMEHVKHIYDIVCKDNIKWVPSSNGTIENGAVPGGRTATGETLYIGRVPYKGSLTPGKIHPSHQTLYIPYDGMEIAFSSYEILIEH